MKADLVQTLFPTPPRWFRGERWVNIVLRSLHLVGVAGIGGGFLFDLDPTVWETYWYLTLATGTALSAIYVWCTAAWLFELKGLVILVKTALLWIALTYPSVRSELFVAIVILSGLIAHAPARLRASHWIALPPAVDHAVPGKVRSDRRR
ncbi:MAG: hypothetical protein LJE59_14765 [Chromatiaceae bacterium]|nr:hypothetical protein [Chromatiaceae bacterium]